MCPRNQLTDPFQQGEVETVSLLLSGGLRTTTFAGFTDNYRMKPTTETGIADHIWKMDELLS
jgi:hypothetical protein